MMAERASEEEGERWVRAGVVEGARVADVGCGPGAVLAQLARRVGSSGHATGVEPDATARATARRYLDGAGFSWVEVLGGRGDDTGLEPAAWDCVMMRHVLIHTGAAAPTIVEHLASLVRPGGHVYLVDVDLDAARTTPPDAELSHQMSRYAEFHRARGNDVRIGPRLPALLAGAALEVAETAAAYACIPGALTAAGGPLRAAQEAMLAEHQLDEEESEQWEAARQRFASLPGALLWIPHFVAVGRRS